MELRQLEYFREIANTGSINEAARKLNMSQPPLSYQIRQLENELNVQLFERTHKGVILTAAGKLLYDRAASLLDYAKSTELEVSQTGKKRVLRIGITPTTVGTIMPYIADFSRKNPDVNFDFTKWQHDLYRRNYHPYDPREIALIKRCNERADQKRRDKN